MSVQAAPGSAARPQGFPSLLESTVLSSPVALEQLETRRDGLSWDEAEVRGRRGGLNVMPRAKGASLARQFVQQLTHGFALMLWGLRNTTRL
jgi:hypothetical protein